MPSWPNGGLPHWSPRTSSTACRNSSSDDLPSFSAASSAFLSKTLADTARPCVVYTIRSGLSGSTSSLFSIIALYRQYSCLYLSIAAIEPRISDYPLAFRALCSHDMIAHAIKVRYI